MRNQRGQETNYRIGDPALPRGDADGLPEVDALVFMSDLQGVVASWQAHGANVLLGIPVADELLELAEKGAFRIRTNRNRTRRRSLLRSWRGRSRDVPEVWTAFAAAYRRVVGVQRITIILAPAATDSRLRRTSPSGWGRNRPRCASRQRGRLVACGHVHWTAQIRLASRSGTRISDALRAAREAAGITQRFTSHGLRRSMTDLPRETGLDPVVAKAFTGHDTDRMRQHYSEVGDAEVVAAGDAIGAALFGPKLKLLKGGADEELREARQAAGITQRLTSHGFRRSMTDLLSEAAVDPVVAKAITGHATGRMREYYSEVRDAEVVAAGDAVGGALFGRKLKLIKGGADNDSDQKESSEESSAPGGTKTAGEAIASTGCDQ